MSAAPQQLYRFASKAHWASGLGARIDQRAFDTLGGLAPFAPFGDTTQLYPTPGAFAPAAARDGRLFWRDAEARIYILEPGDAHPAAFPAPDALRAARRLACGGDNLWCPGTDPHRLECFDSRQLARRFVVDLAPHCVLDLASDRRDGAWVLAVLHDALHAIHIDRSGCELSRFALTGVAAPAQLAWLADAGRLVLLAAHGERLHWFAPGQPDALFSIAVNSIRPCFHASALGSDGRGRIVLAGADDPAFGAAPQALAIDAAGSALGAMALPAPATGIGAGGTGLLVTSADGLRVFPPSAGGAAPSALEASCAFITPVLQSPLTASPRRWLRAEALATLAPGASVAISYASSADPEVHAQALRIAADTGRPAAQRLARLRDHLGSWSAPMVLRGADGAQPATLAVPLFDVRQPWLWVQVALVAAPGAPLPVLHRLDVLYPGPTLMEHLPAVYQHAESEPGNFLRTLVGVLETSTQDLDRRIGAMGSMIDPATAPAQWLDYVARWLGLPWDDAIPVVQKRLLLAHADQLAAQRGTRPGLEALLDALLPPAPQRYRVLDYTAQYGIAALGCGRLPALLGGLPRSALALNRKAILGRGRLACRTPVDQVTPLLGKVEVRVVASAAERRAWEPWLEAVLAASVPVTARLVLRWSGPFARQLGDRLGDDFVLADAPQPHLGTDAVTGMARLPAGRGASLSALGAADGTQLE